MEIEPLKGVINSGRQLCWEKLGNRTVEAMAMQLYLRPYVLNVGGVLQGVVVLRQAAIADYQFKNLDTE